MSFVGTLLLCAGLWLGDAHAAPDRGAVFESFEKARTAGDAGGARSALAAITGDEKSRAFHAEAWTLLGDIERERQRPYSAYLAYLQAISAGGAPFGPAVELSLLVGDEDALAAVVPAKLDGIADAELRAQLALLAARRDFRAGRLDAALQALTLVDAATRSFPRALVLRGNILNQQGKPAEALVPLVTAEAIVAQKGETDKFKTLLTLQLARTYYAVGNYVRAIEYDARVERSSAYWPEATFERAWAHFRLTDVAGSLGLLENFRTPYLVGPYQPEAALLRAYSLFVLCKFPDARAEIEAYATRYAPVRELLDKELAAMDAPTAWADVQDARNGRAHRLPRYILQRFLDEDRTLDTARAIALADAEIAALGVDPSAERLRARRNALVAAEGERVLAAARTARDTLASQLVSLQVTRVDMMQYETRLYERAAATGKLEFGDKVGKLRKDTTRRGERTWPFEGEYWADELGYYRYELRPDCPEEMSTR